MPSASKSTVSFYYIMPVALKNRQELKKYIESIFKKEKKALAGINYIFCSDKHLLDINRKFLQHDFYTDIITFPLSAKNDPVEAEIYISVDRVKDNAKALGESFTRELHRVIFHGALHLCGYKDKARKDKEEMRKKEDLYIKNYF
jgi:probable rRNA maturation factor